MQKEGREWTNHFLIFLEFLIKAAWVFETVPNLYGDLKNTYKGIGHCCEILIHDMVASYDAEDLWVGVSHDGNVPLLSFIKERTKLDTCKSLVQFLKDNSEVLVTSGDDVGSIFKRDLDVQMLVSGFWYQHEQKIVTWKKW